MRSYKFNNEKHFRYEKTNKFFSGLTSRARNAFLTPSKAVKTQEEFIEYLKCNYANIFNDLEWLRFHDYVYCSKSRKNSEQKYNDIRFKIAIVNLIPNPKSRDGLFDGRIKIYNDTGWYPFVLGTRAKIGRHEYNKHYVESEIIHLDIGNLVRVENATKESIDGNSYLLVGEKGNILFDTGFKFDKEITNKVDLICISHFHKDHSAGIVEAVRRFDAPMLMSEATLVFLWEQGEISLDEKINITRKTILIDKLSPKYKKSSRLDWFPVFHCPGSYGFKYTDENSRTFFYLNDVCLSNGFLNSFDLLCNRIANDKSEMKLVLFDSTMVGKSDIIIEDDDCPETIIEEMKRSVHKRNVIFLSKSPEMLVYSFLTIFKETCDTPSQKIIINDKLYKLLQVLWSAVIFNKEMIVDPLVKSLIGKNKSNFIESQRVYPLSSIELVDSDENLIIFADYKDFLEKPVKKTLTYADVFLVGSSALRDDIPVQISTAITRNVKRIASEDWSFHSSEASVVDFARKMDEHKVRIAFCHNFSKKLRRFIRDNSMNIEYATIISSPRSTVDFN